MEKILVIDDEREMTVFLKEILSGSYEAMVVNSSKAAEDQLNKHDWNLVITDLDLSGTNGLELIEKIDGKYPVLVVTGTDIPSAFMFSQAHLIDGFIRKPVDPDTLKMEVQYILSKRVKKHVG